MSLDPKITSALETAKISRYYATAYDRAERSDKLDGKLFASLDEQRRYFRTRRESAEKSLRGDLFALRAMCTDLLTKTTDEADRAAIEAQISAIDREVAAL